MSVLAEQLKMERTKAMAEEFTVSEHFKGKSPVVKSIYGRILVETRKFGRVTEDPKKTSIHLVNRSAFAGVIVRRKALVLNIKSDHPIEDKRFTKVEQVSKGRFHQEIKLTSLKEVDSRLIGWLLEAYALSG